MTDLNWLTQALDRLGEAPITARCATPDWSDDPQVAALQHHWAALYGHHVQASWMAQQLVPVATPVAREEVAAPVASPIRPLDEWWGYAGLATLTAVLVFQLVHWVIGSPDRPTPTPQAGYVPVVEQWAGPPGVGVRLGEP